MRIKFLAMGAVAALALGVGAFGVSAFAAEPAPYKAPRLAFGQPDLGENWSNVSLTPETRRGSMANRAVLTEDEVKAIESGAVKALDDANQPTDPDAPAPTAGGDKPPPGTRVEFAAAGGAVGGYNAFWLDPGNRVMRVKGQPRSSILTTANGQVPPYLPGVKGPEPWWKAGDRYENPENRSIGERCIMGFGRNAGPPMLANGFYNNDYKITQSPTVISILVEMVHDARIIRLNGKHRTDGLRPWMGDSIGRFEGDTLVVETTNIPETQAYHGSWKDLTVIERFTRVGPQRLHYEYSIVDPTMWAQPWGGEYEFSPTAGEIYEYACHEGNYALRHILAGARAEEAAKAAKAAQKP
jgi:hypothetical protein